MSHKFRLSCKNVIDVNIGAELYVNGVNIVEWLPEPIRMSVGEAVEASEG
ncbi:MAG: hypothetical protein KDK33_13775 [Leptospiraceae bacterium]|nr:hypothetical protein [Leptospiraceae bacterium]